MERVQLPTHRPLVILIHLISWVIVFGFPFFFAERANGDINWLAYVRHAGIPLSFMVAFYTNYFFLVPKFLFQGKIKRYLFCNLLLLVAIGVSLHLWQSFAFSPLTPKPRRAGMPPGWLFFARDILSLVLTIGLSVIIRLSMRWSEAVAAQKEAERSRAEAELKNLRNQLNPHFLLNTLNNIYALIAFDSDKAQQAVQELSKLLRHVLYENQQNYVPLRKEIDFVRNYIELMRLRVSRDVQIWTSFEVSPESQTLIAPLIFISLIENAFKHGISSTEHSFVSICLGEEKGVVRCETLNTNFPKSQADKSGSGIGLEQVRRRLEILYPGAYTWEAGVIDEGKVYESKLYIDTTKAQF